MTTEENILEFITDFKKKHGYEPSKMLIHEKKGYTRVTIDKIFKKLKAEKRLKLTPNRGNYELVDN